MDIPSRWYLVCVIMKSKAVAILRTSSLSVLSLLFQTHYTSFRCQHLLVEDLCETLNVYRRIRHKELLRHRLRTTSWSGTPWYLGKSYTRLKFNADSPTTTFISTKKRSDVSLHSFSHSFFFFFSFVSFENRPEDTPWDGGTFKLTIDITEDYPNKAPVVRFVSKMFHPNGTTIVLFCSFHRHCLLRSSRSSLLTKV
jgi:hypothetical protein